MRISLRDYFHALNVLNKEVDVYVDGTMDCCAIVPPIRLTPEGEKRFGYILDHPALYVDIEEWGHIIMSDNDECYDLSWKALRFINSLAGHCNSIFFERWFKGKDAKLI